MLFTRDVSLFGGTCHFEYPSGNGTGWKLWHAAILEEHVNNLIITLHQFLGWFEHNMTCQLWRVTWKYILCCVGNRIGKDSDNLQTSVFRHMVGYVYGTWLNKPQIRRRSKKQWNFYYTFCFSFNISFTLSLSTYAVFMKPEIDFDRDIIWNAIMTLTSDQMTFQHTKNTYLFFHFNLTLWTILYTNLENESFICPISFRSYFISNFSSFITISITASLSTDFYQHHTSNTSQNEKSRPAHTIRPMS